MKNKYTNKYTKKQIREAIAYWQGKLRQMNESEFDDVKSDIEGQLAGMPDIPNYLKYYIKEEILQDAGHDGVGWYDWNIDEFIERLKEDRVVKADVICDDSSFKSQQIQIQSSKLPLKFTQDDVDGILAKMYPNLPGVCAMSVSVEFDFVSYYAEFSGCFDDPEWRRDICDTGAIALDLGNDGNAERLCINGHDVCRINNEYDLI